MKCRRSLRWGYYHPHRRLHAEQKASLNCHESIGSCGEESPPPLVNMEADSSDSETSYCSVFEGVEDIVEWYEAW